MKRAMEEMKDSMRIVNHADDLVHKTDSPFIASITSHLLPSKFKMPTLDLYDGMRALAITLPRLRQPSIFKVLRTKSCVKPFLPH